MNDSKVLAADCPNCKYKLVHHDYYSLFYNLHWFGLDEIRSDPVRIDKKQCYKIICHKCEYERIVLLDEERKNILKTIYPILPVGEPLPDCITEDLRKDFDEARLIVNYSVRCAVGLLRICGEKLCNFIADKYITDANIKKEIKENQNKLQPKIDKLVKHREEYFSFIEEEYIKNLEVVKLAGNISSSIFEHSLNSLQLFLNFEKENKPTKVFLLVR